MNSIYVGQTRHKIYTQNQKKITMVLITLNLVILLYRYANIYVIHMHIINQVNWQNYRLCCWTRHFYKLYKTLFYLIFIIYIL